MPIPRERALISEAGFRRWAKLATGLEVASGLHSVPPLIESLATKGKLLRLLQVILAHFFGPLRLVLLQILHFLHMVHVFLALQLLGLLGRDRVVLHVG